LHRCHLFGHIDEYQISPLQFRRPTPSHIFDQTIFGAAAQLWNQSIYGICLLGVEWPNTNIGPKISDSNFFAAGATLCSCVALLRSSEESTSPKPLSFSFEIKSPLFALLWAVDDQVIDEIAA